MIGAPARNHYRGIELEMYPSMSGLELLAKTPTGTTRVRAPRSMALLGLIGPTHAYEHPCLERMLREFKEYRPCKAVEILRREIVKYASREDRAAGTRRHRELT